MKKISYSDLKDGMYIKEYNYQRDVWWIGKVTIDKRDNNLGMILIDTNANNSIIYATNNFTVGEICGFYSNSDFYEMTEDEIMVWNI